jgi:hypothetical protein
MAVIQILRRQRKEDQGLKPAQAESKRKLKITKRTQMVGGLPNKIQALSSGLSITKTKDKTQQRTTTTKT